ncbi:MAG: long-chain fatty acid--CoA ligase [Bacteroides sp.]|nr:long-chain fatty acid--CoA ligase [Bacteroides sp.]
MTENILTSLTRRQAKERPDSIALKGQDEQAKWYDITWRELDESVAKAARALCRLGVRPSDNVATFSANRVENIITDFACYRNRAASVSIYATSSPDQVSYIVNDCGASVIFVGNTTQYQIARSLLPQCPTVKHIIVIKPIELDPSDSTTLSWARFISLGSEATAEIVAEVDKRTDESSPDDLATLVYTSGTTGEPKGAILPHSCYNFTLPAHFERLDMLTDKDVSMAFLPLSHIFEKGFTYVCLCVGATVAVNRDPRAIQDTIKQVRPTCMCAVPRFWEKVYTAVNDKIESMSPLQRSVVRYALRIGRKRNIEYHRLGRKAPAHIEMLYRFFDRKVFAQLREAIGIDRPNLFPTAGAPVSAQMVEFFDSAGLTLTVGYGLSETTATVCCFPTVGFEIGSVGTPLPGINIRIGDNNEVLVKAPSVMRGYYNKPEVTAEAFTADGWFRTGDAGFIDNSGALWLTDRIKDLFKTSNGKYVAPQVIETLLTMDKYIEQVAVIGESRKFVSALIVPNYEAVREWASAQGIDFDSIDSLLADQRVRDMIWERIQQAQKGLAGYEQIKRFSLLPKEFTMEGGELTNTLKVKRRVISDKYASLIDELYL